MSNIELRNENGKIVGYDPETGNKIPVSMEALGVDEAHIVGSDIEEALASASGGEAIHLSTADTPEYSSTVVVDTPNVDIFGGAGNLANGADTTLLLVTADGVTLHGFEADGNRANNTSQSGSLVRVEASDFVAENLSLDNSPRHGLYFAGNAATISGGRATTIRGNNSQRDLVSVEGTDAGDILVEDLKGTNSADRGTLEIIDGSVDVTARNIRGEGQTYVVAYEDHAGGTDEQNLRVTIDGIRGKDVNRYLQADATTASYEHRELVVRDVRGEKGNFRGSASGVIYLQNIDDFVLEDALVLGYDANVSIRIEDCENGELRNCGGGENTNTNDVVRIINGGNITVRGGTLRDTDGHGVHFMATDGNTHTGYHVTDVDAVNVAKEDIEFQENSGTIDDYMAHHNAATVTDGASGANSEVGNNL